MSTITSAAPSIEVIQNLVTADADSHVQSTQIQRRATELAGYARRGYELLHTTAIPGDGHVLFVDTLTRATR